MNSFRLLAPMLISIMILFQTVSTRNVRKLSVFEDIVTHPLVTGGIGYSLYKSGSAAQKRELKELKVKKQNERNQFSVRKSKLLDFLSSMEGQIDLLSESVDCLENRLSSASNSLRSSAESFTKKDASANMDMRKLTALMRRTAQMSNMTSDILPTSDDRKEKNTKKELKNDAESTDSIENEKSNRMLKRFKHNSGFKQRMLHEKVNLRYN